MAPARSTSAARNTVATYLGHADRHIRPLIGTVKLGELGGYVFDPPVVLSNSGVPTCFSSLRTV
jgi:hypothetical protein